MRNITLVIAATLSLLAAGPAQAVNERDVQVMARVASFVEGMPASVQAVVVDGPGADAVMAAIAGGGSGGAVTLQARKVSVDQLAGSGARMIILPEGQAANYSAVAAAARSLRAVTLSTDMGCVNAGHCVVGIASAPRVEIVVSRAASGAAGVAFAQAFRVMIREV